MPVINTIDLEGVSEASWGDAAKEALKEAAKTIRQINRMEIIATSTDVEGKDIVRYRTQVRLFFVMEQDR
ncbi:MAG: dodecin domain-containing protein [Actinomycetota bacterium]